MNVLSSRRELGFIYKAILRTLIDYYDIKHSWIASRIGMRDDTFSRWFKSPHKSLAVEEMKLFCEATKISAGTIEHLLQETIRFKEGSNSMTNYISQPTETESAKNLTVLFGKDGFAKIMLQINDYMKVDVIQIECQDKVS